MTMGRIGDGADGDDAAAVSVLAVGLERYGLPPVWDLPGAATQAVRFAEWAIRQGVPPGRVRLGCTWLDDAGAGVVERLGVRPVEVGNESLLTTIDELMEEGGELLLVYWCGHGVAGNQLERRLLTSGASEHNLANRFVADIQTRFQSTIGPGFARQVFIIDACANIMSHHDGEKRALPDTRMQPLGVRKARQDFYFSTDVGEYATFDKTAGAAAYSTAILNRLTATEGGGFPPDFGVLFADAEKQLAAASHQHPVYFSIEVNGSGRERQIGGGPGRVVFGNRPRKGEAFVAREQLVQLREVLGVGAPVAVICSLFGMRGAGKSQLASAFAEECEAAGWELVAWITATSRDDTIRQLAGLATECNIAGRDTPPEEAAHAMVTRLNVGSGGDRLVVFDNVKHFDDLTGLIPRGDRARVILTNTTTSTIGTLIRVGGYTREESIEYLTKTTGTSDSVGAALVADALGDLPVALAQAATTIRLSGLDYSAYVTLLRNRPLHVTLRREDGDAYPEHLATALATAITTVIESLPDDNARDTARSLLGAMSLLADTGFPRAWASALGDDPFATQLTVGKLIDTSIVTAGAHSGNIVSLHRLTAAVIREIRTPAQTEAAVSAAIRVVGEVTVPKTISYAEQRAVVASAAAQLAALTTQSHSDPLTHTAAFLSLAATVARSATDLHDPYSAIALAPYVDISLQVLGPDHPDVPARINVLAAAYHDAGDLGRALALFEQSLAYRERVLGDLHPDTLVSRSNLAAALTSAGEWGRSIPLLEKTLAAMEDVLGGDHSNTMEARSHLGAAHRAAGDLSRAIPLLEQTLADRERTLGPDHEDTLRSRNNLATAYADEGMLGLAIPLHEQTLSDMERIFGTDHPDTIGSRNNLAGVYQQTGNYGRAIPLFEKNLADLNRVLGPEHPNTMTGRNNLAYTNLVAKNFDLAITLFEQNLSDRRRVLGADHPQTLSSVSMLEKARNFAAAVNARKP